MAKASSYRSGLSNRTSGQQEQSHVGVSIYGDIDEEIGVLHSKVGQLKNIAQVIETETKYQNELLNQLEEAVAKAQAGVKSAMKKMSRSVIQNGSNHVVHTVLFGILFFTFIYLWAKFFR
ncbi:hypothetical protein R1flu_005480 [Riccia fluitans]|uniref:t-SNARE coiled-coil homology domain-containing protein n=1 Tax=Riccia fluitans TaxID=41844 RepID=A0ABD1YTA6_9MARC